ncbi:MAG: hypothetical protein HC845_15475, partial [Akkermansiaceae bacterium]|nr:hypothetical protein [Akkermansiaceae bacterium]
MPVGSIGNVVFCDTNKDGLRDPDGADNILGGAGAADDEPGINGVTLGLFEADGTTAIDNPNVAGVQNYTVTTSSSGAYSFTGLIAGSYVVKIATPPTGKTESSPAGVT